MCRTHLSTERKGLLPQAEEIPVVDEILALALIPGFLGNESNRQSISKLFDYLNPVEFSRRGNGIQRVKRDDLSRLFECFCQPGKQQWLQLLIQADKTGIAVLGPLAEFYGAQGDIQRATECALKAVERGSDNMTTFNLAILLEDGEKIEEAMKLYEICVEKYGDEQGSNNLAILLEKQKKFSEALKYYQFASEKGSRRAHDSFVRLSKKTKKLKKRRRKKVKSKKAISC